jgi:N-methylhydantoinase A
MGFGGAGPLHVNAVAKLMGSWPAVSPVSPGVLCALGDATTRMRTETARSLSKRRSETDEAEVLALLRDMAQQTRSELLADGVLEKDITTSFEIDVRYHGQAFEVPMPVTLENFGDRGLSRLAEAFDEEHRRLFTFNMDAEHEFVNLRAVALGPVLEIPALEIAAGDGDPSGAKIRDHEVWVEGALRPAVIYDRAKLRAGDIIPGPAIIVEMDSTTLVLPACEATVDRFGNILINPV